MRKHIAKRRKGRMLNSVGRRSWPYTPMEALIVSNPRVDNTHVTENWIRFLASRRQPFPDYVRVARYPGVSEIDSQKPISRYKSGLAERIADLPSNEPDAWQKSITN